MADGGDVQGSETKHASGTSPTTSVERAVYALLLGLHSPLSCFLSFYLFVCLSTVSWPVIKLVPFPSGPLPFWFSWACGCCLSSLLALPACCFESKERRAKKQKEKEEAEGEGRKKEEAEEEGEEGGSRGSRTPTTNALSFFGTNQLLTHTNGGSTNAHNQAEYCAKHRWPKTSDKTKPQQKEELAGCLPTFIASARQRKPKQREIQFRPDVVPLLFSLVSQATVCHHLRAFIQTTVVLRGGEGLIRAFP